MHNWLSYSTALWTLKAAFLAYVIRQTAESGRRQTHQTFGFGFLFVTWMAMTLYNMCQPAASPALVWAYFSFDTTTTLYLAMAAMPLALKRGKSTWETLQWLTTLVCGFIITAAALTRAIMLVSVCLNF